MKNGQWLRTKPYPWYTRVPGWVVLISWIAVCLGAGALLGGPLW